MLGSSALKHNFRLPSMELCELMFPRHTAQHVYKTMTDFLPNLVVFALPQNHRHFCIDLFGPVSTYYNCAFSHSPYINLWRILHQIGLHILNEVAMCAEVVTSLSIDPSASSTSWYLTYSILTYSLRSINIDWTTVISAQPPSYPLSDPHMHSAALISTQKPSLWHHHEFHRDGLLAFQTAAKQSGPLS